jgi:hypothetical protein
MKTSLPKLLITSAVGTFIMSAILSTLPAQAQRAPIGINSRIPGVGSLGTNPGFKGVNTQQRGYYADICIRVSRGAYGEFIKAQPYVSGKIACDMKNASFLVLPHQRF